MGTPSIAVEQDKLSRHVARADTPKGKVNEKKSSDYNKGKLVAHYLYRETLDTIKTILIIGAVLVLCNVTGLSDWWIQFVGSIT